MRIAPGLALGLQWAAERRKQLCLSSRSGSAESRALIETGLRLFRPPSAGFARASVRKRASELTYALQENGSGTQHECWI